MKRKNPYPHPKQPKTTPPIKAFVQPKLSLELPTLIPFPTPPPPTLAPSISGMQLHKLIHVYQLKYRSETHPSPTGWGDFLRGTLFLLQWGQPKGIVVDIHIEHPIKYYLKRSFPSLSKLITQHIIFTNKDKETESEWLEYLKHSPSGIGEHTGGIDTRYVYTVHQALTPKPSLPHREWMQTCLEPTDEVTQKSMNILTQLSLPLHQYSIIHIRFGDDTSTILPLSKVNAFTLHVSKIIYSQECQDKILLLADYTPIKYYFLKKFPQLVGWCVETIHVGEGNIQQDQPNNKIFHTMIDFQLLRYAKNIFSLSTYTHGSGFSEWCAKIYNIPYHIVSGIR